jgi:ligand-binding sensor domain-containing protein
LKQLLLILLYVSCLFLLNAQNPVSRNLTNQNGLPSNTVYNILQDSKGFIWLGHDKGLSRYDGNSFTHFTAPAQQGKSVSNLMEIEGEIWCQDFLGNFYFTKNGTLNKQPSFKSTGAYTPAGVLNKQLLSSVNYDSIKSFDVKTQKTLTYKSPLGVAQAVYHSNDETYFFNQNSLLSFNGKEVSTIQKIENPLPLLSFLIKTNDRFFAFNRNTYPLAYQIIGNDITPITTLKKDLLIQGVTIIGNEIWVCTSTGAFCFDTNMQPLYNGLCFFGENSITQVVKDREDNYWFGTLNKGVLFVSDINTRLFKYSTESITALSSYKGTQILAGTSSSLIFAFDGQNNTFNTLTNSDTKGEIFSLYYDKPINTIITCANTVSFYKEGKKIRTESLAGKVITAISDNTYALAFAGGTMLLPRNNNNLFSPNWIKQYYQQDGNRTILTQGYRGRSVLFDAASQILYTATAEGLRYYDATKSDFINYQSTPIFASSLCIINGELYAGTFSDGIYKITNNKAVSLNTTAKNLTNTIFKLYSHGNNLWITGDELVQRYNTLTGEVTNFTSADGLPKAEIKDIVLQNEKVYIGTTEGLVVFETNKNSVNNTKPLLQLNKFLVNDIEQPVANSYILKSNENNIEVLFSLLSFKDNTASTINYRINNEDWKTLPKGLRNLQLASLAAGKYVIEIKAENEDGIAAEKEIAIELTIEAPFYKKLWFYLLIAGLILSAMYVYFKQRLNSEQKNNELLAQKMALEQELHQSMLSSIKSQMNPHFLFNALNTIQSYIYTNEKENASLYLGKFSELTRTILDMSNKERVTLSEEIKALQLYVELEQLRFEDKLQYSFEIDKNISTETTYIPSMLIQPYVENAIKHGLMHQKTQWKLHIAFKQNNNNIEVTIDDNGIGRKASEAINQQKNKRHQSFANQANEKRLDILNKGFGKNISLHIIDKIDEHGYAAGTTVVLNIPLLGNS